MIKRQQRIERICAVEGEYRAGVSAVQFLADHLRADPRWGVSQGWRARDGKNLAVNLETTYFIRLYAEFESGLRDAWENYFGRPTHPAMKDLLPAIATNRISPDWLDDADEVRQFRNALVHEGNEEEGLGFSLAEARSRLCRFFSGLPEDW